MPYIFIHTSIKRLCAELMKIVDDYQARLITEEDAAQYIKTIFAKNQRLPLKTPLYQNGEFNTSLKKIVGTGRANVIASMLEEYGPS